MTKPNFFIIGAPKCGTTSLAAWLAEHPQVYMSPRKEPNFFNTDGLQGVRVLEEHEALFEAASSEHVAVGEASTEYLHSRDAVPNILSYATDARFIVCLRNPIEMAPALHNERLYQGEESERSFEVAWALQADRQAGRSVPVNVRKFPDRLQYGSYAKLGEQLARLYQRVDRERVLVLILDDLRHDPASEFKRTLRFLALAEQNRQEFPVHNAAKEVRRPWLHQALRFVTLTKMRFAIKAGLGLATSLKAANTGIRKGPPLSPAMISELANFFAQDVELLGRLIDRDLSHWITPISGATNEGKPRLSGRDS